MSASDAYGSLDDGASSAADDRTLIRIGAVSAIIGAVLFMVANILHARSPNIEITQAQIEAVAASDIWLTDHLVLLVSGLLLLGGLVALRKSISGQPGAAWAEFGYVSALVSTGLWVVLIALDGITSKVVHDAYAAAPGAGTLAIAEMMEEIDIGLFSTFIIVFFGVTLLLYGLGVAFSDNYPRWLGWVAVVLATASLITGFVQAYTGLSVLVTSMLFSSFSSFLTLWLLTMGVLMWRRTRVAS